MTHLVIWGYNKWEVVKNNNINKVRYSAKYKGTEEECCRLADTLNLKDESIYGKW